MNRAIKVLLNNDPKALKALNEVFHFDYNKPYQAFKIDGNTTIKQMLKKVENPKDKLIVVLNYHGKTAYWADRYIVGIIDHLEHVEVEYRPHYFHAQKIDTYHAKGDFRNDLKNPSKCPYHIIIAQDMSLLTESKAPTIDYTDRYKKHPERTYGNPIISLTNGVCIEQYRHSIKDDILDKSGYIVEYFRDELKRKARALKVERDKAAFKATDNTAKVEELKIRITAKKLELIELLKVADTPDAVKQISKALESWGNGLSSIMESYDRMIKGVNEKSYPSIEDFNRHYDRINKMLLENGRS